MRFAVQSSLKKRSKIHFESIRPFIFGDEVLDLGAAEGWVGEQLVEYRPGVKVTLCDVVDLNLSSLPHVLYDGHTLPFADNRFDTTLVLLTLHHCQDWERVLLEAIRVTKTRLIITESIYQTAFGKMLLWTMDSLLNSIRSKRVMPEALHFKTADQWQEVFEKRKLKIVSQATCRSGLHRKALYVLDV